MAAFRRCTPIISGLGPERIGLHVGAAMNFAAVSNDRDGWLKVAELRKNM